MTNEVSPSSSRNNSSTSLGRVGALVGSADHKVIGRAFVVVGAASVAAGLGAAAVMQVERAGAGISIIGNNASQLFGAQWLLLTVLGVLPALLGVALVVVPLQVGATRCAAPRLAAMSFWLYLSGIIVFALSYLGDAPYGAGYALAQPIAANPQGASDAQMLHVVGLLCVSIATVMVAACVLGTAVLGRRRGMVMTNAPLFTWSAVSASVVVIVAGGAHIGGVAMYLADQWLGGVLFRPESAGTAGIWQHTLYLWQRPEIAAASILAVGVLSDVVVTTMRRPMVAHRLAIALLMSSSVFVLLMWAQRQPTVSSIFPTNASIVAALWVAPLAAISLLWLATLAPTKGRKPQLSLAFVCVVATFGVLAIGAVFSFVGALSSLPGFTTFNAAHIFTTVVAVPMLALVGATAMWSSQIFGGRRLPNILNVPAVLIVAGATLLIALTEYLAGVSNSPWLIADSGDVGVLGIDNAVSESTFRTLSALTAVAYVVGAIGFVLAVGAYKLAMYGFARPARISRSNGVTLEWAADPRLAYNFENVPAVFSPAPLIGLDDEIDVQNKQLAEVAKS